MARAKTDVTNMIERLEAFEERFAVRLEGLHAEHIGAADSGRLIVQGELHARSGAELKQNIQITVAVYDTSSRLIGTASSHVWAKTFFGFDIFKVTIFRLERDDIDRVRVFPKGT
jgi:hypothetical protein